MRIFKGKLGLWTAAAGLGLILGTGSPAQAQVGYNGNQMVATGTVASVANDVVALQTPNGITSVPIQGTTFIVDGQPVSYLSLVLGEPVEAVAQPAYTYASPPVDLYVGGVWGDVGPYYDGGYWGGPGWRGHPYWNGGPVQGIGPGFNGHYSPGAYNGGHFNTGNVNGGHFNTGNANAGHFGGGHYGGGMHGGGGHSGGGRR